MPETSVTIALRLAQEMDATKQPNSGKLQPDAAVNAADAASLWFNNQSGIDFANLTVDATWSGGTGDLVDATAGGCSVALMSWMVSLKIPLADIASAVARDPYVHLANINATSPAGGAVDCWPAFMAAVSALPQGVQNNDPFNAFGVVWPMQLALPAQIVNTVLRDGGFTVSPAVWAMMIADVTALIAPVPC